jgi:hypothetical protein
MHCWQRGSNPSARNEISEGARRLVFCFAQLAETVGPSRTSEYSGHLDLKQPRSAAGRAESRQAAFGPDHNQDHGELHDAADLDAASTTGPRSSDRICRVWRVEPSAPADVRASVCLLPAQTRPLSGARHGSLHKPDAPQLTEVYVEPQITGFADGITPGSPARTVPMKFSNVRMSGRRHCGCQTAAVAVSRHRQLGYFSRGIGFGVSGRRQDGKNSGSDPVLEALRSCGLLEGST